MAKPFDIESYTKRLQALPQAVQEAAKASLDTYSDMAVDLIKRNVPKGDGVLASTIHKEEGRGPLSVDIIAGGDAAPYAAHLEFGHVDKGLNFEKSDEVVHVPAQPFYFPAVRVVKKKYRSGVTAKVRKAMRAVCKEANGDD